MDWPISRGWSSGSSISNEQFLIFGGLTGDDKDPMRLNDLWTCTINEYRVVLLKWSITNEKSVL